MSEVMEQRRIAQVKQTDLRLRQAAREILATEGWSALAFTRIAERAGVSRRPVHDRFTDRWDVALDLWKSESAQELFDALDALFQTVEGADASADAFQAQIDQFVHPTHELRAAIELLVMSQFNSRLHQAINDTCQQRIQSLCAVSNDISETRKAVRRAYLVSIVLGLLLGWRIYEGEDFDLRQQAQRIFNALQADIAPSGLPTIDAEHFDGNIVLNVDEPALRALMLAAIEEIGTHGFDGAATLRIAERAGFSEGFLFSRYSSKLKLFVDIIRRNTESRLHQNNQLLETIAQSHCQGIADAVFIREAMQPGRGHRRALTLEHFRVSMNDESMRKQTVAALERFVAEMRSANPEWAEKMTPTRVRMAHTVGIGVVALPLVLPDAWQLPFDLVTCGLGD